MTARNSSPDSKELTEHISRQPFYHDEDHIYINDTRIKKQDFAYAFGGTLMSGAGQLPHRSLGNPVPAGLAAFSVTCFTLGLINCGAKDVSDASVMAGVNIFCAGLVDFVAGIWCIVLGNTWATTVLMTFGGFWAGYGFTLTRSTGIIDSYTADGTTTGTFSHAFGLVLAAWSVYTFLLWLCTLKSTYPMSALFFGIWLFVILLCIANLTDNTGVQMAGGVVCFITGIIGLYNTFAGMADKSNSYFVIKPWFMPGAQKPDHEAV